jgi:diguanylate cyclase (GGDEF)-like protein
MSTERTPLKLKAAVAAAPPPVRRKRWRILVVDDDPEVHAVTRMILGKMEFNGRGVELLCAYSAAEARAILLREPQIAVILLDVVMETEDAGLLLVQAIRGELRNSAVRIILRTGQPGQAPEERVIVDFDINDYKAKSELTAQKLFTTVVAALRSYETIGALEKMGRGLEKIIDSTGPLFMVESIQRFAAGVLTQLSGFLGCQPNGIICIQAPPSAGDELQILASTIDGIDPAEPAGASVEHAAILNLARQVLAGRASLLTDEITAIYLDSGTAHGTVVLLHGGLGEADEGDRKLLAVFTSKISIALANALTYQQMVSAEVAATTDFLTGLNNRRQLLRHGVPMVASAHRAHTPLAIAMIDIDHFKRINDGWGHDVGDAALKQVGALLKQRFRISDIVARFGGEEFCIIAANLTAAAAFELFDGVRQNLASQPFEVDGVALPLTVSIGVTTVVTDNVDNMISAADALLYRCKQEGRNRVIVV